MKLTKSLIELNIANGYFVCDPTPKGYVSKERFIYGLFTCAYGCQVLSRWEKYTAQVDEYSIDDISTQFPFHKYFENAPQPLFKGKTKEDDWEIAEGCFRHIKRIFAQLDVSDGSFTLPGSTSLPPTVYTYNICIYRLRVYHICLCMIVGV